MRNNFWTLSYGIIYTIICMGLFIIKYNRGEQVTMIEAIIVGVCGLLGSILGAVINNRYTKNEPSELKATMDDNFDVTKRNYDKTIEVKESAVEVAEKADSIHESTKAISRDMHELIADLNFRKGKENNGISFQEVMRQMQNVYAEKMELEQTVKELRAEIERLRQKDYSREENMEY